MTTTAPAPTRTARIPNPARLVPAAGKALVSLGSAGEEYGISPTILELVHSRISQINGCAWCLEYAREKLDDLDLTGPRLVQLAAWHDAVIYSDAERAALDLAEHMTRLADRTDPVPDVVWDAAAAHFDEQQLAGLVIWIATTNLYNRINVATAQVPGSWG